MANYEAKRQQTRQIIINSMIMIAEAKGLEKVTVSDIIKNANINRSTFYRYFEDKFALINFIESNILNAIKIKYNIFNNCSNEELKRGKPQDIFIRSFLNVIENNHKLLSFLLSEKGDFEFNFQLVHFFESIIRKSLDKNPDNFDDKRKKIFAFYCAVEAIGLISFWVHNFEDYSKDYIYNFINKDMWYVI
ncbi:TetR/AcrR family transcriptional regulator [Apilactobacillus micheneri]|uniref:TetR/AcrR family transcriptional regulator n=1 Tax=Apilactobacillus micheneri TaxID=1899430 RepID=UPI001129501B|nr:TetR/AcrR family transcriptional regulator [Apilactobacillus micheneri]TPR43913.1 TetR/AcrR family transcriptional regulator [Apilactobacillus micheneri]TPR47685.1 TetR/AcrR family transcriptional regulator [Apilactobacillus micheneri]TPR50953.1 TetR/AcrR family transcriptional regulator [Apilactobacillus micheneri]